MGTLETVLACLSGWAVFGIIVALPSHPVIPACIAGAAVPLLWWGVRAVQLLLRRSSP